jgi:hypothetical protein
MRIGAGLIGCFVIALVLFDAFHTIVLARRTSRSLRITRAFYKLTWAPVAAAAKRIRSGQRRESFLGIYGPLSLLTLFGVWAILLVAGFGLLQWSLSFSQGGGVSDFWSDLYWSATTLFTVGTGEPHNPASRLVTVVEGGTGFLLLGLVISYLPVFYQAFSKREVQISLLDARGGSPPDACDLLRVDVLNPDRMERYLQKSEEWAAEILENLLSFPMLAWFRSHHVNQSWLSALTARADCAAVICLCAEGDLHTQSEMMLAMSRHVLVDVCGVFALKRAPLTRRELSPSDLEALRKAVAGREKSLDPGRLNGTDLHGIAEMYEPYAQAIADYLLMSLPPWTRGPGHTENWRIPSPAGQEEKFAVSDPFQS